MFSAVSCGLGCPLVCELEWNQGGMTAQWEVLLGGCRGEAGAQQGPFGRPPEARSRDQECDMRVKSLSSLSLG